MTHPVRAKLFVTQMRRGPLHARFCRHVRVDGPYRPSGRNASPSGIMDVHHITPLGRAGCGGRPAQIRSVATAPEAGPTGFGLYRQLVDAGIDCVVVAPGSIPTRPGDRVKTDRKDARKLARLHASELLEQIWIPDPELEALRDLVRAREDARIDRMRDRHRMSKFVLRHDRRMPMQSWGVKRRKWLGDQRFDHPAQEHAFQSYRHALKTVC